MFSNERPPLKSAACNCSTAEARGNGDTAIDVLGNDFIRAGASMLLIGNHAYLHFRLRTDPYYTIQAVNAVARGMG